MFVIIILKDQIRPIKSDNASHYIANARISIRYSKMDIFDRSIKTYKISRTKAYSKNYHRIASIASRKGITMPYMSR